MSHRNRLPRYGLALLVVAALICATVSARAADGKPNILVIWGDDIGRDNISAYSLGMMGYQTPNIDRLAKEGALFTDSYAQQSCTAGRASFILGQHPFRTGLLTIGMPGSPQGIPDWAPTIADLLKNQGYATGQFGKNHLGDRDSHLPTVHGFDEFLGNLYHLNAEEEPETYYYPKDPEFRKKYGPRGVLHTWSDGKGGQKIEDTGPLTRARMPTVDLEIYDAANKFIDTAVKARSRSSSGSTRRACTSGRISRSRPRDAPASASIPTAWWSTTTWSGGLLKRLDDLGIADNTIVVYGTDNGAEEATWPDGGTMPFQGEKGTTWEGGFRVPMLVRWPGVIKPGTIVNEIFSQEDWLPTLLAAAGEPDIVEKLKKGYAGQRQDLEGPCRRLQLPAVLQGRGEEGPARGDLLLRPGRRSQCRALERLEGFVRHRGREHRHRLAQRARMAGDHQPAGRSL